jgi:hypothetical protein
MVLYTQLKLQAFLDIRQDSVFGLEEDVTYTGYSAVRKQGTAFTS